MSDPRWPADAGGVDEPAINFERDRTCLWFPPDADDGQAGEPPPLLLFLHGIGERGGGGEALSRVHRWGLPKYRATGTPVVGGRFPFLVVAPQCPADRRWSDPPMLAAVHRLIEALVAGGAADPRLIYATGFSMGGIGVFSLALSAPNRFAAIAPVCGRCIDPPALITLAHLPTWIAYAEDDEIGKLAVGSRAAADLLAPFGQRQVRRYRLGSADGLGAHVRTCDAAYADPYLYAWLLEQRTPEPPAGGGLQR